MPRSNAKRGPRIYVTTDLEGVSGVWRFAQTRDRTSSLYVQAVEYMMGDIAALVQGLREAGASKIIVVDGHGGGDNFIPHLMAPGASYITGRPRKRSEGMDKTFDGMVMLGYHAMKGTVDGVLNHTQSSVSEERFWYNGVESGEIAQNALLAGSMGIPVIMVTARDDTHDVVAGLEAGADDYLTKPFAPKELSARIRALLRRARAPESGGLDRIKVGDLEISPEEGLVLRDGHELQLTKTEFKLLVELSSQPGKIFSREVLLERVWGYDYFGDGRLVDVHVRRLRTKIEADPANPRYVVTSRGLGYKLQP